MLKFIPINGLVIFFVVLIMTSIGYAASSNLNPVLMIKGQPFSLELLQQKLKPVQVIIDPHPVYKNQVVQYDAFVMVTLLEQLFHINFNQKNPELLLEVKTADNYLSYIEIDDFIKKGKAFLAFQQSSAKPLADPSEDKKWSLVRAHDQVFNPGPFYLVWNTTTTYPVGWPFQVTELNIIKKSEVQFNQFFKPASDSTSLKNGYKLFLKDCSSCHSLYYKGTLGKAPDLGKVANYLTDVDIQNIIRKGFKYMPPIGANYSDDDIRNTIEFLHWINLKKMSCDQVSKPQ